MDNYKSIENKYSSCGLANNRLNNLEDLERVHNIDITQIPGFVDLDELNKQIFAGFIVNYYNAQGLEIRENLQPTGIYFVEDITYYARDAEDNMLMLARREITAIYNNGEKEILHRYVDEEYGGLTINKTTTENYLRFEFREYNKPIWLHIKGETNWY